MQYLKRTLRSAYRFIRGGGEPSLVRRKEYHNRRRAAELQILEEAKHNSSLLIPNKCPACEGTSVRSRFTSPIGFSFTECSNDGMVYMDPVPSESTLARLYNDSSYTFHWSVGHSADAQDLERVLRYTRPKAGQSLLDVGCATGEFLKSAEQYFECHGVEINADTAAIARSRNFDITTGTLGDVSGSERFDVVSMLQVIEHITDPASLLREVRELLKPEGLLYLNTPCIDSASFQLFHEMHVHVSSFAHVSLFTHASLAALAARCGFTVAAHGYCGGRDVGLHDVIGHKLFAATYRHRSAFYSPRFMNGCDLIDRLTFGALARAVAPTGNESYQWAVLRK